MDIRYIAWAGYDLLGAVISTGVQIIINNTLFLEILTS